MEGDKNAKDGKHLTRRQSRAPGGRPSLSDSTLHRRARKVAGPTGSQGGA